MNRSRRVLLSFALMLVFAAAGRAQDRTQDIDAYIKGQMQSQHIPGLSVAVIKDGTLIKAEGYGLANIEHGIPVRSDTVFKIGSVSKQLIATGIILLVQDGKIAVDDKVSRHLEGTPETWQGITIRHLLTHTSGLVREAPGFDPYKVQPEMDVIQTAYQLPLQFQPGEKYQYCNLGYFMLAEIIHRVSGKSWGDFLNERVFAPLGMNATRVTTVPEVVEKRAHGYEWREGKFRNMPNWPAIRPSGAFLSTALDLAKWEAALLTDRILKEATKKEMWTPVTLNDGKKYPYGFGWQLDDFPPGPTPSGIPMIRHGGSLSGFRAYYCRWPKHRITVIVLTNLEGAQLDGLVANIGIHYVPELKQAAAAVATK